MRILVLNNDVMERSVIQQVLEHNGHKLVMAGDTDDAMQTLQEGGIQFVIVERTTTDVDEKQFVQRIRTAAPYYIYIIMITSKEDAGSTVPKDGPDDYLRKPLAPIELKSRVRLGQRMLGLGDNLVNARNALEKSAMFDTLTSMLNETAFITLARGELERARRGQSPLSLLALQLDKFNDLKKMYGEDVGNDVLVLFAKSIRENTRPYDNVGRYEEDIFLMPLPGVIGQDAEKIANRIVKRIQNTEITLLDGTTVNLKLGSGIVSAQRVSASMEIEMLIGKAAEAVARARQNGDDQAYTIFI